MRRLITCTSRLIRIYTVYMEFVWYAWLQRLTLRTNLFAANFLIFTTLWAYSSDDKLFITFYFISPYPHHPKQNKGNVGYMRNVSCEMFFFFFVFFFCQNKQHEWSNSVFFLEKKKKKKKKKKKINKNKKNK